MKEAKKLQGVKKDIVVATAMLEEVVDDASTHVATFVVGASSSY